MEKFKFFNKNRISLIPKNSGIYAFSEKKEILYIGKAINIRERIKSNFQQPSYKDDIFINRADRIGVIETGSEIEALILEAKMIKKYQPRYNVMLNDDKTIPGSALKMNHFLEFSQPVPYIVMALIISGLMLRAG